MADNGTARNHYSLITSDQLLEVLTVSRGRRRSTSPNMGADHPRAHDDIDPVSSLKEPVVLITHPHLSLPVVIHRPGKVCGVCTGGSVQLVA